MTSEEALIAVIDALNESQIPYMVVGSFSSNFYGVARSTNDADVVVRLPLGGAISEITRRIGPEFRLDPQAGFETITSTMKFLVRASGTQFTIELFRLSDDPHDQQRFNRREEVQLLGRKTWLPRVEDVIVTKVRWAVGRGRRGKDFDDVRNVIAVSGKTVEWEYVHHWCDQHGTRELLDEIRASIPPE